MRNFYTQFFLTLSLSLFSLAAQSAPIDISELLLERNELNRLSQDQTVKNYLFNHDVSRRLNKQLVANEIREYVIECQLNLKPFIKSEKVLGPVCYLLRNDNKNLRTQIFPLIKRYIQEAKLALYEISTDPRYDLATQNRAYALYRSYKAANNTDLEACFKPAINYTYPADFSLSTFHLQETRRCLAGKFSHLTKVISKEFANHPGHLIAETGWTNGNKITYLAKNDLSENIFQEIKKRIHLVPQLYPLNGRGSVKAFYESDHKDVFTEAEGFPSAKNHFVWNQKSGIFKEIIEALNNAQETIFVDIFFLGGTMGASLAKHIIELIEQKPQLKVLILRDQINHFGHEKNMLPIFNFLLAYSFKNPARLVILPADIKNHLSGLPGFLSPILSDDLLNNTGLQKHLDLYGRAMSDHSKVFVIDGKTSNPIAFVGSKNLTDESGAFCYDEVAKVEGPAAAVTQDDYYLDIKYALRAVDYSEAPYNFPQIGSYVDLLARSGWSADLYQNNQDEEEKIANIILPFDLLDRDKNYNVKTNKVSVEHKGPALVRTGMTNVDSTRSNLIDQVVQLIKSAQSKILIKDQFLFDRNVVLALIEAKKKAQAEGRNLEIKAILEPLAVAKPQGMPNLLYLDRLKEAGIEVKWMLTYSYKPMTNGQAERMTEAELHSLHEISQEMHMKTISADGKFVIVGSANKDQTTMYGAFREQQLEIYDTSATAEHDKVFYEYWNNPELTQNFDKFNFNVPPNFKTVDGKVLSPQQFIVTLRNILSIFYDWTAVH